MIYTYLGGSLADFLRVSISEFRETLIFNLNFSGSFLADFINTLQPNSGHWLKIWVYKLEL